MGPGFLGRSNRLRCIQPSLFGSRGTLAHGANVVTAMLQPGKGREGCRVEPPDVDQEGYRSHGRFQANGDGGIISASDFKRIISRGGSKSSTGRSGRIQGRRKCQHRPAWPKNGRSGKCQSISSSSRSLDCVDINATLTDASSGPHYNTPGPRSGPGPILGPFLVHAGGCPSCQGGPLGGLLSEPSHGQAGVPATSQGACTSSVDEPSIILFPASCKQAKALFASL